MMTIIYDINISSDENVINLSVIAKHGHFKQEPRSPPTLTSNSCDSCPHSMLKCFNIFCDLRRQVKSANVNFLENKWIGMINN